MINNNIPVSVALISLHIGWLHFFVSLPVPSAFVQQPPAFLHKQQKGNSSMQSEEPKIRYTWTKLVKKCQERIFTPLEYALYTPKYIGL